ncbi:IGSF9B [Mytilus edulis]|uniref:IGSF9B n=1 Tax=Mytilus edulis TaxID=6550 RepID=A0A8S3UB35_MYTED|nr:IGSF9B [Mytilus edulis]
MQCSEDARIFTWTYKGTVNNQRVTFKCGMDFGTNLSNITYGELTVERSLYVTPSNTTSVSTQKPDPPTNVSAVCKETSMTVLWRSGYDGGYNQSFKVVILNSETNQTTYYSIISDQGEAEIMEVTFDSLSSTTLYIVSVQATNIFGTAELDADVHCTTLSAPKTGQSDMISAVGIGACIESAVIILVLTSIVVLFYKKRINENKERNSMYQTTARHESNIKALQKAEESRRNGLDASDYGIRQQHLKNDIVPI